MISLYAMHFKRNGSVVTGPELIQSVPSNSGEIRFLDPTVKNEWGNAESMDMSIQSGTKYFDAFMQMRTYILVDYDGTNIFYGRVLTIDNGYFGERKIHCEGPLSFLNDTYYPGVKKDQRTSMTAYERITKLLSNHNAQVDDPMKNIYPGEVPGNYSSAISEEQRIKNDSREFDSTSWQDTKSALEDLKSHYGGAFRIRYEGGRLYLDWLNHYYRSTVNSQKIEIGKNLIDLSSVTEVNNIFTAVIAIGKAESSDEAVYLTGYTAPNGYQFATNYFKVPDIVRFYSDSDLNSGYHRKEDYAQAINNYGMIYKTVDFQEAHTQAQLLDKTKEWIKDNYQGSIETFTVKAIDLHFIGGSNGKILVGDRVQIIYKVGNEDGTTRTVSPILTCTGVQYDLYSPENNQYTFGIPASSLSKNYASGTKKSVNSKSTTPSSSYSPPSEDTEEDPSEKWRKEVYRWLRKHQVWYKSTGNQESGPAGRDRSLRTFLHYDASLDENGNSKWELWNPAIGSVVDNAGQKVVTWIRDGQGRPSGPSGHWSILTDEQLTIKALESRYIFEYVRDEYGISLRTGLDIKQPAAYTDEDGNLTLSDEVPDITSPQGMTTMIARGLFDGVMGGFTSYGSDAQGEFKSEQRTDGSIVYYRKDASGDWQEVDNIRNLSLSVKQTDDFVGSVVVEGNEGTDEKLHIYNFGQAIERHPEGEIVVAYVDGDKLMIGSDETRWSYQIANRISTNWVKPFFYTTNDQGEKTRVYLDPAGTVSYRGYYDSITGDFVKKETGDQGPHGEPIISVTGTGVWDEKNLKLKGGIQTGLVDGQYVTFVKSDRLVIGNGNTGKSVTDALLEANVITYDQGTNTYTPQGLVTQAVYAQDIYAINGRFQTIYTDYLTTQWVKSQIAQMDNVQVRSIVGVTGTATGTSCTLDTFYSLNQGYYINLTWGTPGSGNSRNLVDGIYRLSLTQSGNNYTLKYYNYRQNADDPAGGTVVGTFSRAISSFSGAWSGNGAPAIFTVTADPQGQEYAINIQQASNSYHYTGDTPYWDGYYYKIPFMYYVPPTTGEPYAYPTSILGSVDGRSIVNSIEAESFNSTFNTKETVPIQAKNSSGTVLKTQNFVLEKTTYVIGSSGLTNHCVNLRRGSSSGTVFGRINTESVYNSGYSDGNTAGVNSVTAYSAYCESFTDSPGATKTNIGIVSRTSTGKTNNSTKVDLVSTTRSYSSGSTYHCVELREGSTVRGRINIESVYSDGYSAGDSDGYTRGRNSFTRLTTSRFYCTRESVATGGYKYTLTLTSSTLINTLTPGEGYILYK